MISIYFNKMCLDNINNNNNNLQLLKHENIVYKHFS